MKKMKGVSLDNRLAILQFNIKVSDQVESCPFHFETFFTLVKHLKDYTKPVQVEKLITVPSRRRCLPADCAEELVGTGECEVATL